MVVIYGKDLFGYVDRVPGQFSIATEFLHFWYIPTIPLKSYEIREFLPATEPRNLPVPLDRRSVVAAYMRSGALGASILLLVVGAFLTMSVMLQDSGELPHTAQWTAPLVASFAMYLVYRRSLRRELATPERARAFGERLGMSPELIDGVVLPTLAASRQAPPSGVLRIAILLAGLASLAAGESARRGLWEIGWSFDRVSLAEAPARAESFDRGYIEVEGSLDRDRPLWQTDLTEPYMTPLPPDRVTKLDAAALADDARLTPLLGARVEVSAKAEGIPLRFEYEAPPDTSRNLRMFPLGGTGGRVWVASRWFELPADETRVASFVGSDRFTGRLTRLASFEKNVIRAPGPREIDEEARRSGQAAPPEGAFLIQTGGRYREEETAESLSVLWAYLPLAGAPEPILVEDHAGAIAELTPPFRGHISRNTSIGSHLRQSGMSNIPKEGALVLDVHWPRHLIHKTGFRIQVLLALGVALLLLGMAWRMIP